MIAAQVCKAVNIFRSNQSFFCDELVTDGQFLKIFFEWMDAAGVSRCARLKYITHCCDHIRRTLNSHPLHIMFYAAHATHFFTTTGTAGTAMHQQWQWRTMSCIFFGTLFIQNQNPSMVHTCPEHILFGNFFIGSNNCAHQRTFSHFGQCNRFIHGLIRHECRYRAKRFHFMYFFAAERMIIQ